MADGTLGQGACSCCQICCSKVSMFGSVKRFAWLTALRK